jgi:hypothetical protein
MTRAEVAVPASPSQPAIHWGAGCWVGWELVRDKLYYQLSLISKDSIFGVLESPSQSKRITFFRSAFLFLVIIENFY